MATALIAFLAIIIPPDLQDGILSAGHKMLALLHHGQGINLTLLRAIDLPDDLPIEFLPVGDLPIGAGRQQLVLFGVENHLLEEGGFEHADDAGVGFEVPDYAAPVAAPAQGLVVVFAYLDRPDPPPMLF